MTKKLLLLFCVSLLINAIPALAQERKRMQPLLFAAAQGEPEVVNRLLKQGLKVNAKDELGRTALHYAAIINNVAVCTVLLDNGANIEIKDNDGGTPLNAASERGSLEAATFFLDRGADINAQYKGKMTSLNMALHKKFTDLALMLIERGADVSLANQSGVAPMDVVLKQRFDDLFWPVFNAMNIDPDQKNTNLIAYLDIAVGLDNLNLFNSILEKAPQLSAANKVEIDLFFKAAGCGSRTMLDYFLENGRRIDEIMLETNWSVLHLFVRENELDLITFALNEGLPVDSPDFRRWTPLHVAAHFDYVEAARMLLDSGAAPNAKDESGSTPLHIAAAQGNTMMIRLLIAQGASPADLTDNGRTPLDIALFAGHHHLRNVFPLGTATVDLADFDYTGTIVDLRRAVLNAESETVKRFLLIPGTNLDLPDKFGMTLLHYAADLGNTDITRNLISAQANVNFINPNSGWTPLFHAVNGDYDDAAKLLMMAGADVNIQDSRGWTALHIALFRGNKGLTDALRVAGARDDLRNHDNQLPKDIAGLLDSLMQAQEREIPAQ